VIPPNPVTRQPLFEISEVTGLPRPTKQMTLIKAQMNVPIYWVLLAVAEIVRARARIRERERQAMRLMAQLNESRLAGLRAQIQPHFLFNTLNSISVLIQRDPRGANEMLLNLSELLRMSLRDDSSAGIPLREELRLLRLYVGIQRIRFSDRLRFEEEIDEEALDAQVPTLLLQPLVENALRHGIEADEEPGFVRLRVAAAGDRICIVIENSCPADPARVADGPASTGIGLRNTAARLSAFFGEGHRFGPERVSSGLFRVEIGFDRRAGGAALAGGKRA
jgi:sensor histidine kinase YesM